MDCRPRVDSEHTICNGATLVVNRTIQANHNDIVVAAIDGDITVKRLFQRGKYLALVAQNSDYSLIVFGDEHELSVWGVVIAWKCTQSDCTNRCK
ncbi:peptidase s24 and s26 domain-containing protein [Chitinibacter fontanus]|uniref:Peptidase s24 and s26 domain-containing protein n=1 Tax=Chitinibacter fontanus TaxID=1737446 RepID=A0A7D5Z7F0_9NEIS|nr:peptidase s24 and s26 domain-containing protein [Chitinibacter fontanus]